MEIDITAEENVFEVEKIVGVVHNQGKTLYRVRWKGYGPEEDTLEPRDHLLTCEDMIDDYLKLKEEQDQRRREARKAKKRKSSSEEEKSPKADSPGQSPQGSPKDDENSSKPESSKPEATAGTSGTKKSGYDSEEERRKLLRDPFWDDLEHGRIRVTFETDMYSKVKSRRATLEARKKAEQDTTEEEETKTTQPKKNIPERRKSDSEVKKKDAKSPSKKSPTKSEKDSDGEDQVKDTEHKSKKKKKKDKKEKKEKKKKKKKKKKCTVDPDAIGSLESATRKFLMMSPSERTLSDNSANLFTSCQASEEVLTVAKLMEQSKLSSSSGSQCSDTSIGGLSNPMEIDQASHTPESPTYAMTEFFPKISTKSSASFSDGSGESDPISPDFDKILLKDPFQDEEAQSLATGTMLPKGDDFLPIVTPLTSESIKMPLDVDAAKDVTLDDIKNEDVIQGKEVYSELTSEENLPMVTSAEVSSNEMSVVVSDEVSSNKNLGSVKVPCNGDEAVSSDNGHFNEKTNVTKELAKEKKLEDSVITKKGEQIVGSEEVTKRNEVEKDDLMSEEAAKDNSPQSLTIVEEEEEETSPKKETEPSSLSVWEKLSKDLSPFESRIKDGNSTKDGSESLKIVQDPLKLSNLSKMDTKQDSAGRKLSSTVGHFAKAFNLKKFTFPKSSKLALNQESVISSDKVKGEAPSAQKGGVKTESVLGSESDIKQEVETKQQLSKVEVSVTSDSDANRPTPDEELRQDLKDSTKEGGEISKDERDADAYDYEQRSSDHKTGRDIKQSGADCKSLDSNEKQTTLQDIKQDPIKISDMMEDHFNQNTVNQNLDRVINSENLTGMEEDLPQLTGNIFDSFLMSDNIPAQSKDKEIKARLAKADSSLVNQRFGDHKRNTYSDVDSVLSDGQKSLDNKNLEPMEVDLERSLKPSNQVGGAELTQSLVNINRSKAQTDINMRKITVVGNKLVLPPQNIPRAKQPEAIKDINSTLADTTSQEVLPNNNVDVNDANLCLYEDQKQVNPAQPKKKKVPTATLR